MSKYLQLEFKSGFLFEYSGSEKEGFTKYVPSEGKVSYRKYYERGIEGEFLSANLRDGKFGKQVSLTIKDESGDYVYIPVDIKDQKGNVSQYAESLISLLPKLEKGLKLHIQFYNFKPKDSAYSKIGVSIKVADTKLQGLTSSYYSKGELVEGDIPAIVWEEDPLDSAKKTPSLASVDAKNKYLLKVLKEQTDRLQYVKEENQEQSPSKKEEKPKNSVPTATPDEAFEPTTDFNDEKYDDLPF